MLAKRVVSLSDCNNSQEQPSEMARIPLATCDAVIQAGGGEEILSSLLRRNTPVKCSRTYLDYLDV